MSDDLRLAGIPVRWDEDGEPYVDPTDEELAAAHRLLKDGLSRLAEERQQHNS